VLVLRAKLARLPMLAAELRDGARVVALRQRQRLRPLAQARAQRRRRRRLAAGQEQRLRAQLRP